MTEPTPSIARAAAAIAKGEPPVWLTEYLARFARLIGDRTKPSEDHNLQLSLKAIDFLENELMIYAMIEEKFDFIEIPDCVDRVSQALTELREFFQEQLRPKRKGGPTPNDRRRLCAFICAEAWRRQHGKEQPFSTKLHEACEEYWRACGQDETSKKSRLKNWERYLVK